MAAPQHALPEDMLQISLIKLFDFRREEHLDCACVLLWALAEAPDGDEELLRGRLDDDRVLSVEDGGGVAGQHEDGAAASLDELDDGVVRQPDALALPEHQLGCLESSGPALHGLVMACPRISPKSQAKEPSNRYQVRRTIFVRAGSRLYLPFAADMLPLADGSL